MTSEAEQALARVEAILARYPREPRVRADKSDLALLLSLARQAGEMREALEFYAMEHEFPSDGPWGVNSTDFGDVARAALSQSRSEK